MPRVACRSQKKAGFITSSEQTCTVMSLVSYSACMQALVTRSLFFKMCLSRLDKMCPEIYSGLENVLEFLTNLVVNLISTPIFMSGNESVHN